MEYENNGTELSFLDVRVRISENYCYDSTVCQQ